MALTISQAPWPGHDTRFYRPGDPIVAAADNQADAHWAEMAAGYNLALGTLLAGQFVDDSWADGQGALNTVGFVEQLRYIVPPQPSSRHDQVRVRFFATGVGTARITTIDGADSVDVALAGANEYAVDLDVDTAAGFDELIVKTDGTWDLDWITAGYIDEGGAGWPAADGVLGDEAFTDIDPLDLDDFAADELLSSGRMLMLYDAEQHLVARRRSVLSTSALAGATVGPGRFVARPIRRAVPVGYRGRQLDGRARIANPTAGALNLWVRLGEGRPHDIVAGEPSVRQFAVEIAAGAPMAWMPFDHLLRDDQQFGGPRDLPGWTEIAVYPEPGLELHSISLIEAP